MNKPQLSAEIIKLGIINEDGSITFAYNELATALEDERNKVIEEVDGMIAEVELVNESNGRYNACQELKAKLNQLKGKNDTR